MSAQNIPGPLQRTLQMNLVGSNDIRDIVVRIGLPERDPLPGGDFRGSTRCTRVTFTASMSSRRSSPGVSSYRKSWLRLLRSVPG
jgi:hypothetical protein